MSVAVVIPAFNEEKNIGDVVNSLVELGHSPIVVSDGSIDKTVEIARAAGAVVLEHEQNQGYESALNTGFEHASANGFEFAVTFDADGQFDPNDIEQFAKLMTDSELDLVIGIRSFKNRIAEHVLANWTSFRFGIKDPLCGLKLYRVSKAKDFFPFDSQKLIGMELAIKMVKGNCSFSQRPIRVTERDGESRYGTSLSGELKVLSSLGRLISNFGIVG